MPRSKFTSPTLQLRITAEQHAEAVASKSGGCLIADAIKRQYPNLSGVTVDMATIRVSDRKAGQRYTYLTPAIAQHLLLSFDQGWPQATEELLIRRAVKITPIVSTKRKQEQREARLAELETKEAAGDLTKPEKATLGKMRKLPAPRPRSHGKADVRLHDSHGQGTVVSGGVPLKQGEAHPNLLRGRDRHFGAKLSDPGEAFQNAVDEAVALKLAEANGAEG